MSSSRMRYRSAGEIHPDFHGVTHATIHYLLEHFGMAALEEVFRATATGVYREMHRKLGRGDRTELLEFWRYYLEREHGDFSLETDADAAVLTVKSCPGQRRLDELGIGCDPLFCLSTTLFNQALCEGTPFVIDTEKTGPASCCQTLRRREELP